MHTLVGVSVNSDMNVGAGYQERCMESINISGILRNVWGKVWSECGYQQTYYQ